MGLPEECASHLTEVCSSHPHALSLACPPACLPARPPARLPACLHVCPIHPLPPQVWDYQTKSCVQTLEGHTHNVSSVCFHPELPIIVTSSEDGTIRIWHSTTYR